MKKILVASIFGAAGLIAAYGARQLYLLYNSSVKLLGTRINSVASNEISLVVYAELENNSDISATVNDQNYTVLLNGLPVSTIRAKDIIHINSNGRTVLPIAINLSPDKILTAGINNIVALLLDRSQITLEIKGSLSLKAGIISMKDYPIEMKYTLQELIELAKDKKTV